MSIVTLYIIITALSALDGTMDFFSVAAPLVYVLLLFVLFISGSDMESEKLLQAAKAVMRKWWIPVLCIAMSILTPSRGEVAAIVAAYWATNSEEARELPSNVVKTLNDFLKDAEKE